MPESRKGRRNELLAIIAAVVGASTGLFVGLYCFQVLYVKPALADNPDAFICGNSALDYILPSMLVGGLIGATVGEVLKMRLSRR
jgi:H+/Cl- antiporter ClcA